MEPTIRCSPTGRHIGVDRIAGPDPDRTGPVAQATRERVLSAIADLGYKPNALARALVRRRTGTIGIVMPDVANPFYAEVLRGMSDVAGLPRWEGYRDAAAARGHALDASLVVEKDYRHESGYQAMLQMLANPEPPTAVVAASDLMACDQCGFGPGNPCTGGDFRRRVRQYLARCVRPSPRLRSPCMTLAPGRSISSSM